MKIIILFVLLISTLTSILADNYFIIWEKSFGGMQRDYGFSIYETKDNGFIVAGRSSSNSGYVSGNHGYFDAWLIKFNSIGNIEWSKLYGGSDDDYMNSIIENYDSTYIISGSSTSSDGDLIENKGFFDGWITKINKQGNIVWSKSYGGTYLDVLYGSDSFDSNNYFICGSTSSSDGDLTENKGGEDFWVLNIDSTGNLKWHEIYGGSNSEYAYTIIKTFDNNLIIGGSSKSDDGDIVENIGNTDFLITKVDTSGNIIWIKNFGGTWYDQFESLIQSSDSGYVLVGSTQSSDGDISGYHGSFDALIIKINKNGIKEWAKTLGGSKEDILHSVRQTHDKGYIAVGYSLSDDGDISKKYEKSDYWLVKLDSSGDLIWSECFGGNETDFGYDVIETSNKDLLVVGYSDSNDGDVGTNLGAQDMWIFKLKPCETNYTVIDTSIMCGESIYLENSYRILPGTYYDTIVDINGCERITQTNLTVDYEIIDTNITETICYGDSIQIGDSSVFKQEGNYTVIMPHQTGCDTITIVHLELIVNPKNQINITKTICSGDSIQIGDSVFKDTGEYSAILSNQHGCDSIVHLELIANPVIISNISTSICEGEFFILGDSIINTSGIYVDTLQSYQGCDSIVNLLILVNKIPVLDLGKDTIIDKNNYIILDAGNQETYLWSTGQTAQMIRIDSLMGLGENEVSVLVSNEYNCFTSDTIVVTITDNISSSYTTNTLSQINIFPNPTKGILNFHKLNANVDYIIKIIDIDGNQIINRQLNKNENKIDITELKIGIYLIEVSTEKEKYTQKVIIE